MQEYAPLVFSTISTRSGIKKAVKREEILIDGEIAKTSDWIKENQKIQLVQRKGVIKKVFHLKLEVVFEDDHLAVINKPAGFPTSGNYFRTIENALPLNLKPSPELDALPHPKPVHRLDNPTSGLLLVAKTIKAATKLQVAFEKKEIQKIYLAIVSGETPAATVYTQEIAGKPSITSISTLEKFNYEGRRYSLIEASPETGRTHQIRIHLSGNSHPIIGDIKYGGIEGNLIKKGIFLSAVRLCFRHPSTGDRLEINLETPKKFRIFQKLLSR